MYPWSKKEYEEWQPDVPWVIEALMWIWSATHWWLEQTCGLENRRQEKKKKGHALRRFNKQHMFHRGGYSTLDWWVPTRVNSRAGRLWQDPVRYYQGRCYESSGWLSVPILVSVCGLSLDRFLTKGLRKPYLKNETKHHLIRLWRLIRNQREFLSQGKMIYFLLLHWILCVVWNHTAQVHPFVLAFVRPLQVILKNLGCANDDVIFLHNLCERDFELRVSTDSLHFVRVPQKWQELCGIMLLDKRNLQGTRAHSSLRWRY